MFRLRTDLTVGCRVAMVAISATGLVWGALTFPNSQSYDDLSGIGNRLLKSETFDQNTLTSIFASSVAADLSPCAVHPQRAMLLIEMVLADASLRAGLTADFDRHIRSLEQRGNEVLACAPRDSFAWLVMFNLEMIHGRLNAHTLEMLATSYDMSPHEAWISNRRCPVAMPVLLIAGEPLRRQILQEFQHLLQDGFFDAAATSYLRAPAGAQSLLASEIEKLSAQQQGNFRSALRKQV